MTWIEEKGHYSKTMTVGSATIIIRRPVLTESEYKQKEALVKSALESYARAISSQSVNK